MKIAKLIAVASLALIFCTCKKSDPVTGGGGGSTLNPDPVILSISPNAATAGGASFTLTVTGNSLTSSTKIQWNGTSLSTSYISATQVSAAIPAAYIATAGVAGITLYTPAPGGGISASLPFTISNVVVNNPVPVLTSVSPATTPAGGTAFTITANGNNFINGSTINWNGAALVTSFINAGQLTALVPAVNIATAGTAAITVVTAAPGGGTSAAQNFTITAPVNPLPSVTTISPNNATAGGAAFTLTVTGSNFISSSAINWNGAALSTTYISGTQLSATVPAANIASAGTAAVTVVTPLPGGGTSSSLSFTISSATATKKFLFDATHAETAGNADWVIDEDGSVPQRIPTPAQSTVTSSTPESYWTGALSSWGIALAKQNYTVETLPSGTAITYGNAGNPQDLSNYDVFVVDEPNNVFTAAEKTAIVNFVKNGGGLLMISDHTVSDRDGDGWDSPAIWNDLMTNNTVQSNPFGFSIDLANFSDITSNILTNSSSSPILTGSQGNVSQMEFNNGTTATLNTVANPNVKGLIWKTGATQNNNNVMALSSVYGTGRVFFVGDSSPMDDGSGASGNTLYPDWVNYSHAPLMLNASLWLAKVQ